ncbi:MAG: CehA/McbA family metallohydrolase [Anaerolineae bacterium]
MFEIVGNLHVHTTYSDGEKTHAGVAAAAIRAGLDFVVITDHNVRADGLEGLYRLRDGRSVLLLIGEEVHDMLRQPQRNHLLAFGAGQTLAPAAQNQPPQALLDAVRHAGGLAFLAHPIDVAVPWAREGCYSWETWEIEGFTGLELWNYMSSIKDLMPDPAHGIPALLDPDRAMIGPNPDVVRIWDDLLAQGKRVVAFGNADAHSSTYRMGPIKKVIYPYEHLFRCVNTHLLVSRLLTGDPAVDGPMIYGALGRGHAFVGYGRPGDPRGFRFEARQGDRQVGIMGDALPLADCDSLHVSAPLEAELRIIYGGQVVARGTGRSLSVTPSAPGAYRAEAWRYYRGKRRGWVFSNPIYLQD